MKSRLYEELRHMLRENGIEVEILNQNPKDITDFDILIDFSEHDKKVTEEKNAKIRELKRQIEDLEAIIADGKKPDISVSENGVSVGCECGGYHLAKKRIAELEEKLKRYEKIFNSSLGECDCSYGRMSELEHRHQSDCIEINRLHTALEVMTEKYMKLREVHGL